MFLIAVTLQTLKKVLVCQGAEAYKPSLAAPFRGTMIRGGCSGTLSGVLPSNLCGDRRTRFSSMICLHRGRERGPTVGFFRRLLKIRKTFDPRALRSIYERARTQGENEKSSTKSDSDRRWSADCAFVQGAVSTAQRKTGSPRRKRMFGMNWSCCPVQSSTILNFR